MSLEIQLFNKAMAKVNSILKVTGLHLIDDDENPDKSLKRTFIRRWYFFSAYIWFNLDVLAESAWFFHGIITGKSLLELTFPAPCLTHCFLADVKGYYLIKNEKLVNDLIRTLKMLQTTTASSKGRNNMEKEMKSRTYFLITVTNIQCALNVLGLAGFAILPFVIMVKTFRETGEIQLMLPYVGLFPFDASDPRIWPFMYFRQLCSSSLVVFMVFGADVLYYGCCNFIQIQFRCLYSDLERIHETINVNRSNERYVRNLLAVCVERHKNVIRCVSLLEQIYSKSTLLNVVSSSMLICLTGFNVTAIPSWPLMMPFVAFVFLVSGQIFLFCYYGDIVIRSSTAISDAAYNCQWYNLSTSAKKDILFILIRAQKPCKLTAYGFSDIDLSTFGRILSTAWSYFALLSTVNN